jgi:valacyclovir hydrolase
MAWFEHAGSRIYYEEEGSGQPLLLVPGWSLSIDDLVPLRKALVRDYRVISADPPGSGRSGPQPRHYSPSYYEDDSRGLLALLEKRQASMAHLVGFSDGGEYALLMAAIKPEAVQTVVTWGAAGKLVMAPEFLEAFSQVVDHPIPPLQQFSEYLKSTYGPDNARIMAQSVAKAWGAITVAGGEMGRKRAGEISCPALLITGEHDAVFAPPGLVSEMAAAMQQAEFIEVKGADHLVHHTHADWLVKTIVNWLSKH